MIFIGVTMRVDSPSVYDEVRDGLDQQWLTFLHTCGLTPILMPNSPALVKTYIKHFDLQGILLTGGNSPTMYGGESPERDQVDSYLLDWACQHNKPLIGVCRGMQSIQLFHEQPLHRVSEHVKQRQKISINDQKAWVNSYHTLGATRCQLPLQSWAVSDDGVIKAIKHINKKVYGMMWHPERNQPFVERDINFFKQVFSS